MSANVIKVRVNNGAPAAPKITKEAHDASLEAKDILARAREQAAEIDCAQNFSCGGIDAHHTARIVAHEFLTELVDRSGRRRLDPDAGAGVGGANVVGVRVVGVSVGRAGVGGAGRAERASTAALRRDGGRCGRRRRQPAVQPVAGGVAEVG